MPGIFLGSTELSMGAPVTEVYYGSTKVWPVGTPMQPVNCLYGIRMCRYNPNNNNLMYQSNPAFTLTSVEATVKAIRPIGNTSYQRKGFIATLCAGTSTFTGTPGTNQNYTTQGNGSATAIGNYINGAAGFCNVTGTFIMAANEGDDIINRQRYAKFSPTGAFLWSMDEGWSCTNTSAGQYAVTLPPSIRADNNIIHVCPNPRNKPTVGWTGWAESTDPNNGTFAVKIANNGVLTNTPFSVGVLMVES